MQSSMKLTSKLPSVYHLDQELDNPNIIPQHNDSVRALEDMLNAIVSSIEPTTRTKFIEAVANASSSRRGLEQLMNENLRAYSPPFGSGSGSTEVLPRSPLSATENIPIAGRSDTPTPGLLHPLTPGKERTSQTIPDIDKLTHHLFVPNDGSDEAISAPRGRPRRQITVKHYSDATPSMHCHICCRSSKNIKVYACARIKEAICRKVVCSRCFIDNNWEYTDGWECSHCRGKCPARSQCFTYGRSNLRRKLQASKRKLEKYQRSAAPNQALSSKLISKKYVSDPADNFAAQMGVAEAVGCIRSGETEEKAAGQ